MNEAARILAGRQRILRQLTAPALQRHRSPSSTRTALAEHHSTKGIPAALLADLSDEGRATA